MKIPKKIPKKVLKSIHHVTLPPDSTSEEVANAFLEMKGKKKPKIADPADKILESVMAQINKDFGENTVMKMDPNFRVDVPFIPTGNLAIDHALGIGGFPRGRIVEIYGPESSGKTTLCLSAIAQAQRAGGKAVFIDVEHAYDPDYARKLGVRTQDLLFSQPGSGEEALQILERFVSTNSLAIAVVDSVAALTTKQEIAGEIGDAVVGAQARLMSSALRKLTSIISRSKTCVIFTNQLREKIGVMFGNPETTPGGKALKFYSSMRLDIRRATQLKDGETVIGNRTKVKVVKNKLAPPHTTAEFDLIYGEGVAGVGSVVDLAIQFGVLVKRGSWISYEGSQLAQGRDGAKAHLKSDHVLRHEIEGKVKIAMSAPATNPEEEDLDNIP